MCILENVLVIEAKKHSLGPISVLVQRTGAGGGIDNIQPGEEALTFYKGVQQRDLGSYITFRVFVRDV